MILKFALDLLKEAAFECEVTDNCKELSSEIVDIVDFLSEFDESKHLELGDGI